MARTARRSRTAAHRHSLAPGSRSREYRRGMGAPGRSNTRHCRPTTGAQPRRRRGRRGRSARRRERGGPSNSRGSMTSRWGRRDLALADRQSTHARTPTYCVEKAGKCRRVHSEPSGGSRMRWRKLHVCRTFEDGETRTRTGDTTIFSRVLYQLSYLAGREQASACPPRRAAAGAGRSASIPSTNTSRPARSRNAGAARTRRRCCPPGRTAARPRARRPAAT
jgi:hypothetical protein